MSNMLERGAEWLASKLKTHASLTITYARGEDAVELRATPGHTEFEVTEPDGAVIQRQTRDYLVLTEDLVIDGAEALPMKGDVVRETRGDITHVYEVSAPGSERCYRFSDPYRKMLRIHTQQTGTEDA